MRALAKWQAHIRIGGKSTYLGLFESVEEAGQRVQMERSAAHGAFARHA